MKKLKILLIASGLLVFYSASGQVSIDRSVIGSAGGNAVTTGTHSASWTLGETMISSRVGGTITLGEGFQQGSEDVLSVEVNKPNVDLVVFPNPTKDKVVISVDASKAQTLKYALYSPLGQMINLPESTMKVSGHSEKSLDLSHLAKGTYLLQITADNGEQLSTIRIIKD